MLLRELPQEAQDKGVAFGLSKERGTFRLVVPPGVSVAEIIPLVGLPSQAVVELVVGEGAAATVVDIVGGKLADLGRDIHVHVEPQGNLSFITVVQSSSSAHVRYIQRGMVESEGVLLWRNVTAGGAQVEHSLVSEVVGEGGQSTVDWVVYGRWRQQYDLRVQNVFSAPHGSGEVMVKGVAEERAHITCRGAIVIGRKGGGATTHLTQHILMLDATAQVDAVPALEIKTNDVKASHSATVTRISDEDLFYCASRGIGCNEARRILVEGFLGEPFGRIEDTGLREVLEQALQNALKRKPHA